MGTAAEGLCPPGLGRLWPTAPHKAPSTPILRIMQEQPPPAPQPGTGLAFVPHWDWVAEKGLLPPATARAYRAAVSQILKIDDGWEDREVQGLDVDAHVSRFRDLSSLSPTSLSTYESRFRSALASYLGYLENSASHRPRGRRSTSRGDGKRLKAKGRGEPEAGPGEAAGPTSEAPTPAARLVVYPFPVRQDLFAELKLPADLSWDEALWLGRFLEAVARSDPGSSGA
jgi:hypothetical protein